MVNISDEIIIERIRNGDENAMQYLFDNYKFAASTLIKKLGGDENIIEDLFIEAMTSLYQNIIVGKFSGGSSLKSYFLGIVKFRYLSLKRKELDKIQIGDGLNTEIKNLPNTDEKMFDSEKAKLLNDLLNQLGEPCKKSLTLYMNSYSMAEIAKELGFSNAQSAKNRLFKCRNKLRQLIMSNPLLHDALK